MRERIREIAVGHGINLFGIASVDRFEGAPKGFHPRDIYSRTESVIVFAVKIPTGTTFPESRLHFTHLNALASRRIETITRAISRDLNHAGIRNVPVAAGHSLEFQEGKAILSLGRAAVLAGLGRLGRNNLLINRDHGNMIQIGALLTDEVIQPDPLAEYEACPAGCRICLNSCPRSSTADSDDVICRSDSSFIEKCFECRKKCPRTLGIKN